jgi:hypothetical protein
MVPGLMAFYRLTTSVLTQLPLLRHLVIQKFIKHFLFCGFFLKRDHCGFFLSKKSLIDQQINKYVSAFLRFIFSFLIKICILLRAESRT